MNRAELLEGVLEDSLGGNELPKQIPQFSNVIYHTTATYTIESSICRVFVDGAWVSPHTYHSSTGTAIPIASKRFCIYRLYVSYCRCACTMDLEMACRKTPLCVVQYCKSQTSHTTPRFCLLYLAKNCLCGAGELSSMLTGGTALRNQRWLAC